MNIRICDFILSEQAPVVALVDLREPGTVTIVAPVLTLLVQLDNICLWHVSSIVPNRI